MCRLYEIVCVLFRTRLIFPRINSPNEKFEVHSRLSTTRKLRAKSSRDPSCLDLEYLEVDFIVNCKTWFCTSKQLLRITQLSTILYPVALVNGLMQLLAESGGNSSKLCFGKRTDQVITIL